MGLLDMLFRRSRDQEDRSMYVRPAINLEAGPFSGEWVSPSTADRNTAVARAVDLIANDISKLPRRLMRRTPSGSEPDTSSALWRLFDLSPNVGQSGFEWFRLMTSTYLYYGNAVALIQRNGRNDVLQLLPLDPNAISVVPDQATGDFYYRHATLGDLEPEEVLHLKPGQADESGVWGVSPIQRARESLGLARAQEKAGASVYRNASTPRMALKHPGVLSDKAAARLAQQFSQAHAGPESAGKAILLEEGMDAMVLQPLELESQQWLEARNFSVQEVSRIFGVPVPYLSEHSKGTYSNVQQLVRMYVDSCLSHHVALWSAEIQFKLLSPDQFLDFDLTYVQRGSFQDEIDSLNTAVVSGIMTPNECRHRLGLNSLPGLDSPRLRLDTAEVDNQETDGDGNSPADDYDA